MGLVYYVQLIVLLKKEHLVKMHVLPMLHGIFFFRKIQFFSFFLHFFTMIVMGLFVEEANEKKMRLAALVSPTHNAMISIRARSTSVVTMACAFINLYR